jgi:hypothetical protein
MPSLPVNLPGRLLLPLLIAAPLTLWADDEPWRLQQALAPPEGLTIDGSYRLRYESLDNTYRAVDPGHDDLLASRFRLQLKASGDRWYGGFEFQDSRAWLGDAGTPIGTDDINVLEPLQVYAGFRAGQWDVRAGRMTMDVGSRRLVSRNRFRNTTNIFTGINAYWRQPDGVTLQAFLTMPAARLPNTLEPERLRDNEFELDQERSDQLFWGLYLSNIELGDGFDTEWYLYGLREDDRPGVPTRNRDFLTAGVRVRKVAESWSLEVESAIQSGDTRAGTQASDTTVLDHRAWFTHVELEHDVVSGWPASVIFRYDYASGDDDPDDDEFNRFDSLFGDRRWEFGPTGIYGALARSNISSPGVALRLQPMPAVDVRIDYRAAWLASDRDAHTTSGLRDPNGESGSFLGQQLDVRWRWNAIPDNLSLELGAAYLRKGEFLETVPGAPPPDDTIYGYLATNVTF